jgi:hypothetical protein
MDMNYYLDDEKGNGKAFHFLCVNQENSSSLATVLFISLASMLTRRVHLKSAATRMRRSAIRLAQSKTGELSKLRTTCPLSRSRTFRLGVVPLLRRYTVSKLLPQERKVELPRAASDWSPGRRLSNQASVSTCRGLTAVMLLILV